MGDPTPTKAPSAFEPADNPAAIAHLNMVQAIITRLAGNSAQYLFSYEYDTALLAGPPMVGPRRYAQTRTNMVRDACSPTQHLAR